MGIHFKRFCDQNITLGKVPDVLDMSTPQKDAAVMALLRDNNNEAIAENYPRLSEEGKNSCYQSIEWIIRDAIDSYNESLEIERELMQ